MMDTFFLALIFFAIFIYLIAFLSYNSHTIKWANTFLKLWLKTTHFNHFKVYNSEALSAFMMLCNHHHYPVPELFHLPNGNPILTADTLSKINLIFCPPNLAQSGSKKKNNKQNFFKGKQNQRETPLILLMTAYESVHILVQNKKIQ